MANFLFFMEHLAPPSQVTSDPQAITTGGALFQSTGCASCHSPVAFTTPAAPFNGVPGSMQFFPFSDFLVHDMGTLGDGIGETGDSLATTRQMQRRRCGARGSTRSSSTMAARRPCSTRSSRRRPGARGAHQLQQARFHEPVADRPVRQHAVASRTWALRCSPAGGPLGLPGRRARRGQLGTRDRLLATPADPRERHRWPKLRPNYV
jgi:hypothetical protein